MESDGSHHDDEYDPEFDKLQGEVRKLEQKVKREERRKQIEDQLAQVRKELEEKLNKKKQKEDAESSEKENPESSEKETAKKTEVRTDVWSLPQLARRKTPSIQQFARERNENEPEGSYMKSKRREVEFHFRQITSVTAQLREGIKEVKEYKEQQKHKEQVKRTDEEGVGDKEQDKIDFINEVTEVEEIQEGEEIENKDTEEVTEVEEIEIEDTEEDDTQKNEIGNEVIEEDRHTEKGDTESVILFTENDESSSPDIISDSEKERRPKKISRTIDDLFGGEDDSEELEDMERKRQKIFHRKAPRSKFGEKSIVPSFTSESSEEENGRSRPRRRQAKKDKRRRQKSKSPDRRYDPDYRPSEDESEVENEDEDEDKDKDIDEDKDETGEEKKAVKEPGKHRRKKINCPRCKKILAKSGSVLRAHYRVFHKLVPVHEMDNDIGIVTKRTMRPRKDGTPSGENVAKKDRRRRRKTCKYCGKDFSESHLRADHLNLASKVRCSKIPEDELKNLNSAEKKKQFTSDAIKGCKVTTGQAPKLRDVYAGDTHFTVEQLVEKAYTFSISYQGKYYLDAKIADKRREDCDPEERKLKYRPVTVKHLQRRVLGELFLISFDVDSLQSLYALVCWTSA